VLAACGSNDSTATADSGGGAPSGDLGKTSDVPVGGAKIYAGEKVVVSQPTQGQFKAFSNICTHRQCAITKLEGDEVVCGCHGSRFRVEDGSVAKGPASEPLETLKVTVQGDDLVLG
jgi:nitrite reductase/ring-hydroxylating ferredoxin subunit